MSYISIDGPTKLGKPRIQKINIPIYGQIIRGTLLQPKSPNGAGVLFIHGWTSSQKKYISRAKSLVDRGLTCLTIDLRGHGLSDGNLKVLTRQNHLDDIQAAYKYLSKHSTIDPDRIGLYGKSYGGYLTAILSSVLNPKTIVLCAPALYPDAGFTKPTFELIQNNPHIFQSANIPINDNKALISIRKYYKPVMLIQLGQDEEIPSATIQTYLQVNHQHSVIKHVTIPQSNHGLDKPEWNQAMLNITTKWFIKHL